MAENKQFSEDYYIIDNDELTAYIYNTVYIIWGCVAGGLLIVLSVIVYLCIRSKRNRDRRRQLTGENLVLYRIE